ncbi:MAG: cupin domain-containing protein [Fidelibacterota bacterium]|nr:MAG: cupin domain-containing protein [Candidatus Neomarinimicrobiota bacterium]
MKYVYGTTNLKRYQFPTHRNDLVMDRSEAVNSEVFVVILEPGQAPPLHQHDDTEQIFYILEGEGTLLTGEERVRHPVGPGDVVRIPASTWHSIEASGEGTLCYLAVDCFVTPRPANEQTWDDHVKVLCQQQGWDYESVVT